MGNLYLHVAERHRRFDCISCKPRDACMRREFLFLRTLKGMRLAFLASSQSTSLPAKEVRLPATCIRVIHELVMSSRSPTAALRHISSRTYRSHLERTAESLRSKVCSDIIQVLVTCCRGMLTMLGATLNRTFTKRSSLPCLVLRRTCAYSH